MEILIKASLETLYMVGLSLIFTIMIGLPLGIVLVITQPGHIAEQKRVYKLLSYSVNMTRSLPFVILMIFIMPLTRWLVGTSIGTQAAMVPLVFATIPFFARIVESALQEVDQGIIEAAISMGASPLQIIVGVLVPESIPSLILGATITAVNLLGYSAMAGAIGGGGLGDLAIRYGYHRFQTDVMVMTIVVLIVLVQLIQTTGNVLANKIIHIRRK